MYASTVSLQCHFERCCRQVMNIVNSGVIFGSDFCTGNTFTLNCFHDNWAAVLDRGYPCLNEDCCFFNSQTVKATILLNLSWWTCAVKTNRIMEIYRIGLSSIWLMPCVAGDRDIQDFCAENLYRQNSILIVISRLISITPLRCFVC